MKKYYKISELSLATASSNQIKKAETIETQPAVPVEDEYFDDEIIKVQNGRRSGEQFFYNSRKPCYSYQDRILNETPQSGPTINHWGEILPGNADFFKLPKNIGRILSGYTTLSEEMNPLTGKEVILRYVKLMGAALAISAAIILGFSVSSPVWIAIWAIVPFGNALWIATGKFKHTNTYIGVNGFAEFKCRGTRNNIVSSFEVNFKDVTDLLKVTEVRERSFDYANTAYGFVWLNNNKVVKEISDMHYGGEGNAEREHTNYWLHHFAEKYWTMHLLDNMDKELETKGYIEFSLFNYDNNNQYVKFPYIQLGVGYIKFITPGENITCSFNEIKKIYTKGTNLFIEYSNHTNNLRIYGKRCEVPLINLSNRQFFFKALELLLGYKFS